MKEPHGARHPPRPRVMRRDLVTGWRSVDRGSVSRAIELRKKQFPCDGVVGRGVVHTVPRASVDAPWTRTERSHGCPPEKTDGPAGEGEPQDRHVWSWEVGRAHSTDEAREQRRQVGGAGGGKGSDQGNTRRRAAPRTPSRTSVSPGLARVRQGLCALALDPR